MGSMTEEKQQPKAGFQGSKYMKMLLVIIMALLLFGGPYVVYVFIHILEVGYLVSTICGFAMVLAGLMLMWYLIKTKVIS